MPEALSLFRDLERGEAMVAGQAGQKSWLKKGEILRELDAPEPGGKE